MRVLVSGSSGLIGSNLINHLQAKGHDPVKLVRSKSVSSAGSVYIDYENEDFNIGDFEGFDAVVHLAGENIVGRWTKSKRERLRSSRIDTTRLLVSILKKTNAPPKVFMCASAIGIYGSTGNREIDEDSPHGYGFLPELAVDWEREAGIAEEFAQRVVKLRIGLVLAKNGGALEKMLTPFKFGLGGNIGNGKQYWSWISIDDIVNSIEYILLNQTITGAVNLVSPSSCTNAYFTRELAGVLKRPAFFHMPAILLKAIFGEMGEQVLLFGTRVYPKKLIDNGYKFLDTDLSQALKKIIN